MTGTAATGEAPEGSSTLGFITTLAILATLLTSTLSLQLFHKSEPAAVRPARLAFHSIWPQGWAFFANYGDLPTLSVFQLDQDPTTAPPLVPRQMSSSTLWGLTGASMAGSREASYIRSLIPAESWHSCGGSVTAGCLSDAAPLSLVNRVDPASLCGPVAFVLTAPENSPGTEPDTTVAVLRLACAA
ncbi:hypothetical protein GCM10009839_87510 [Catenulispora yoronensis]|uniref:SdpA family antimicrobial peptide system protein n=1 Tax=Catenulispora yoronensis TaxID=450799 RepID=A0ABN2VJC5_9ACTN